MCPIAQGVPSQDTAPRFQYALFDLEEFAARETPASNPEKGSAPEGVPDWGQFQRDLSREFQRLDIALTRHVRFARRHPSAEKLGLEGCEELLKNFSATVDQRLLEAAVGNQVYLRTKHGDAFDRGKPNG